MKKTVLIISIIILVISLTIIGIRLIPIKPFYLNENYYGVSEIKEITIEELNELIEKEESFGLFIYQPMCLVSSSFGDIVEEYSKSNKLTFYKIPFSKIKNTPLENKIEYYPSFVLYKEGEIKTYLDATKNSDIEKFSNKESFENWFTKYIKLREKKSEENNNAAPETPKEENKPEEINLKGVTREEGKVNVYFFWGNGCPHCKEEFKFLSEIEEEYGHLYNLYTYEVWYNEENEKILKEFGRILGVEIKGVPFIVIGSKSYSGFAEVRKQEIIDAIKTESRNNFDIYFDKIQNTN